MICRGQIFSKRRPLIRLFSNPASYTGRRMIEYARSHLWPYELEKLQMGLIRSLKWGGKKQAQQQLEFPRPLGPLTQFADAHK